MVPLLPPTPQKRGTHCLSITAHFWREHGRKKVRFPSAVSDCWGKGVLAHVSEKVQGRHFPTN